MIYTVGIMKNKQYFALPTTLELDCFCTTLEKVCYYAHIFAYSPLQAIESVKNRLYRAMRERQQSKYIDLRITNEESILSCNTLRQAKDMAEKSFITVHLISNRWNISATARQIGINRKSLTRLAKKYGLVRP